MIEEFGGKEAAKTMITLCLKVFGRANEKLIASLTGLPVNITVQLLAELEHDNCIYH
jgi:hypothetical protein